MRQNIIYTFEILKQELDNSTIAKIDLETILCDVHDYLLTESQQVNEGIYTERSPLYGTTGDTRTKKIAAIKKLITIKVEEERLKNLVRDVTRGEQLLKEAKC